MRVLVEQTYNEVVRWLDRLGSLAGTAAWNEVGIDGLPTQHAQLQRSSNGQNLAYEPDRNAPPSNGWASQNHDQGEHAIAVHLLIGGAEKSDWALWPERDAILIGTQDMLISRALNRGYAASRARWPMEFGLLNSDCLWVFDEIQIMDTSLATSLQLDAWRRSLRLRPKRDAFPETDEKHLARPCHSLWISATMAKHWLERAVDWTPRAATEWNVRHQLGQTERIDGTLRSGQLFRVTKSIDRAPIDPLEKPKTKENRPDEADAEWKQADYLKRLANYIGKPGNHAVAGLTLVIVNTVDRATTLFNELRKQPGLNDLPIKLIHSRFRPYEREQWNVFLTQRDASRRILVSTQVVEAGVDLSASILYTELAPWASLVQRFGRCARYPGQSGRVIWLDLDLGSNKQPVDHWARPYERSELVAAREKLETCSDVGLASLAVIKAEMDAEETGRQAAALFPYQPRFVLRNKDLFDLFDTTPDLTGADIDISRYIRDGVELDVQVFWREMAVDKQPARKHLPQRDELCPVPFHRFREFAHNALRVRHRIWRRRYSTGRKRTTPWELLELRNLNQAIYPGQVFLLEKACGGYSPELGWTGDERHGEFALPSNQSTNNQVTAADDEDDADDLSELDQWLTVLTHSRDVCQMLDDILVLAGLTESDVKVLRLAARWHDRGKAHPAFPAKLKAEALASSGVQQKLDGQPPAKAPADAWRRDKVKTNGKDDRRRPGFRHELASALAILETLRSAHPVHEAFTWPDGLEKSEFGREQGSESTQASAGDAFLQELAALSADELDLLVYLVASHHGKVRMSLRSSPEDEREDVPDPCPHHLRQTRGVRDDDPLPLCRIPAADWSSADIVAPEVRLSLDPMLLGLSPRYGASWRERAQSLLERRGPFQLGYLEALLRAADCRASSEEGSREGKSDGSTDS